MKIYWPIAIQFKPIASGALLLALVACSAENDELRAWMDQQKKEVHTTVAPLIAPKKFLPEPYASIDSVDPFSQQKLSVALKKEAKQPNSLLATEMNRRKEPLESFPLDGMTMVGSLQRTGQLFALLKVDNLLYQVKSGDYLGQNFGRVTKISETEISLREIVQDAAGEWIERASTLQLQEKGR